MAPPPADAAVLVVRRSADVVGERAVESHTDTQFDRDFFIYTE